MKNLKRLIAFALILSLSIFAPVIVRAALNANVVWECRDDGDDSNGGGFKSTASGTDYSLSAAPHATLTTASAFGTGPTAAIISVSAGDYTVNANDVGNILHITGGTASVGYYEITAVNTGSNTWTMDRTAGSNGTVVGRMGGYFLTPGRLCEAIVTTNPNGHKGWVKKGASDYTISTATVGPGGPMLLSNGFACTIQGYDVTRGDFTGNRPTINWGAVAAPGALTYLISGGATNSPQQIINFRVDGNHVNNVGGINCPANSQMVYNCRVINCNGTGAIGHFIAQSSSITSCSAVTCTTGFSSSGNFSNCVATSCTTGFSAAVAVLDNDLAFNCSGDGFLLNNSGVLLTNCTSTSNTGDGFDSGNIRACLIGCLSTHNKGYAFNTSSLNVLRLLLCADYSNTLGRTNLAPLFDVGAVNLSADPYLDRVTAMDFRPNTTSGGGAALRGAGIGVAGQAATTDIGAVHHSDPTQPDNGMVY